jgi:hypothetical protein
MFWRNRSEKVVVLGQFLGLLGVAFIAGRSIGAVADFLDGGWWAEYLNLSLGLVCGAFLLYASHHLMRRDQDRMQRLRPVLIVLTGIMLVTRLIQLPLEEFYISDYVDGITSCF